MKFFVGILLGLLVLFSGCSPAKKITISGPADSKISVNGVKKGSPPITIKVPTNERVIILLEKWGYFPEEKYYVNDKISKLPKNDFIELIKDPSLDPNESVSTDICNRDIDIPTSKPEEKAWKIVGQIVTSYFDVLEVTDRNTGYMRTAWELKSYNRVTIRTRLIIKLGRTDPLTYKVKLVSERAEGEVTAKKDELFEEWNLLLRAYENIVPELQSRLGEK